MNSVSHQFLSLEKGEGTVYKSINGNPEFRAFRHPRKLKSIKVVLA